MHAALVVLVALAFLGMGLVALYRPPFIVGLFGCTSELTRDARSEVRAVYGGFGLAVAALLLATLWEPAIRGGVLVAVAASLGGMAAGRVMSALVDGVPRPLTRLILGVEVTLMAALLWAW